MKYINVYAIILIGLLTLTVLGCGEQAGEAYFGQKRYAINPTPTKYQTASPLSTISKTPSSCPDPSSGVSTSCTLDGIELVQARSSDHHVSASCPSGKRIIGGACHTLGGDALTVAKPVGDTFLCQYVPIEEPMEKTATAFCAPFLPGYEHITGTSTLNYVSADCPSGKQLIGGGCEVVGGTSLTVSKPIGDTWLCQYVPVETAQEKTAHAICADLSTRNIVSSSRTDHYASVACPSGTGIIGGGCASEGGRELSVTAPVDDTWLCQYKPTEPATSKTAFAICLP